MSNSKNNIPTWLLEGVPDESDIEKVLTPSRQEMYKALELYHNHVKYVITIIFSILTAMFAILGLSDKLVSNILTLQKIKVLVGMSLIAVFPITIIAIFIIWRYYLVYVSALVFAVRVHWGSPFKKSHPWLIRTMIQADKCNAKVKDDYSFIKKRARSWTDTFMLYVYVLGILSILSLCCGVVILMD